MSLPRKPARPATPGLVVLEREVRHLLGRLVDLEAPEPSVAEWVPAVDVYECDGLLTVVAEVPGLAPDALRVSCREGLLVMSGQRRERRAPGAGGFLCMERHRGRFQRAIPLEVPVDVNQAEARLVRGLLIVTLPRLKDRRGRETVIPVRVDPTP